MIKYCSFFKSVGFILISLTFSTLVYSQDTTYARVLAGGESGDLIFLDENYEQFTTVDMPSGRMHSIADHYPDNILHMVKVAPAPNSNQNLRPFYSVEPFTGEFDEIVNFGISKIYSTVVTNAGETYGIVYHLNNDFLVHCPLSGNENGEAVAILEYFDYGSHGAIYNPVSNDVWYFGNSISYVKRVNMNTYAVTETDIEIGQPALEMASGGFYLDGKMMFATYNSVYEFDTQTYSVTPVSTLPSTILSLESFHMLLPGSANICVGDSTELTSRFESNSYGWLKDGMPIPNQTNSNLWVSEPGNYNLVCAIGEDSSHYVVSEMITMTMASYPEVSIDGPVGDTLCPSFSLTLTSSASMGNQWYKNGSLIPGAIYNDIEVSDPGLYNVLVTNSAGCSDSLAVGIPVYQYDDPLILNLTASASEPCMGDSVLLSASGADSFDWYANGDLIENEADTFLYVVGGGVFNVRAIDPNGCLYYSNSVVIDAHFIPIINLISQQDYICPEDSVLIEAEGANTYEWYFNGELLGLNSPEIFATQPGSYNAVGFASPECADSASAAVVLIEGVGNQCTTSLNSYSAAAGIRIFPNPVHSKLTIQMSLLTDNESYSISDVSGAEVKKGALVAESTDIDVSNLQAGFYILRVAKRIPVKFMILR